MNGLIRWRASIEFIQIRGEHGNLWVCWVSGSSKFFVYKFKVIGFVVVGGYLVGFMGV